LAGGRRILRRPAERGLHAAPDRAAAGVPEERDHGDESRERQHRLSRPAGAPRRGPLPGLAEPVRPRQPGAGALERVGRAVVDGSPMSTRATTVRWKIVGLLLAYAALVHFNRLSIAVAGTERLMDQFKISEQLMGVLSSAYLITYTLLMTPGGWFIDRFGSRASLLLVGFGSALCVGLCGGAGFVASAALMIPALIVLRLAMGVTNVPFHPAAAHAVSRWIPAPQRAWANGLVNAAALAGISCTYYLFGFMMDRLGW